MNTSLLSLVLVHGLVAGGFALLFRALPWPKGWINPVGVPDDSPERAALFERYKSRYYGRDWSEAGRPAFTRAVRRVEFWAWFWRKFWGCKACAAGRPAALLAWWEPTALGLDAWCLFFGALALGAFIYAHAGPMDIGGD